MPAPGVPKPKPKSKSKAKAKAKASSSTASRNEPNFGGERVTEPGPSDPLPSDPEKSKRIRADPELEALDMKRKVMLMGNKWRDKLVELDQEVTMSVEQAEGFAECKPMLGCRLCSRICAVGSVQQLSARIGVLRLVSLLLGRLERLYAGAREEEV